MRILQLGNLQVVPALRALGHDVRVASELRPDLVVPGQPVDVRVLHREVAPDADAFFMADTLGLQTLADGVEDLPIPRLYWAIDVHLNHFWQRHYAGLFDLVLVAQLDYLPFFEDAGIPARWLPWGIDPTLFRDQGLARTTDAAFVGVIDANRGKRAAAVEELRHRFGLVTFGEDPAHRLGERDMARVFGSAKIVFNESVLGDVNFRTFEAMACGALLVTEHTGNGLTELFTPGEHLVTYGPDDLIEQVERFLADDQARARIARAGAIEVATRHTMAARMARVSAWLTAGVPRRETTASANACFGIAAERTVVRGLSDATATIRLAAERLHAAVADGSEVEVVLSLAAIMTYLQRDDGALGLLALAREARPDDPRAGLLAGEIERRRGNVVAGAAMFLATIRAVLLPESLRSEAIAALDDDPTGARACFALGLVLQAAGLPFVPGLVRMVDDGLPRTAIDYFQRSLAIDPDPRVIAHVAALLELAGRCEFARSYRERLMRDSPTDAGARADFARVLHRSYARTAAAHQARVAAVLAGDELAGTAHERGAAFEEAGLAWLQSGATERALAALDRARALLPPPVAMRMDTGGTVLQPLPDVDLPNDPG